MAFTKKKLFSTKISRNRPGRMNIQSGMKHFQISSEGKRPVHRFSFLQISTERGKVEIRRFPIIG